MISKVRFTAPLWRDSPHKGPTTRKKLPFHDGTGQIGSEVESSPVGEKPTDILDTLNNTVEILYPNIYRALAILLTMPVSTATAERSFSTMRMLKPYLRSTMLTNRLTRLALMNVYRNTFTVVLNKAVDMFARKKLEHGI